MLTEVGRITLGAYGLSETRFVDRVVRTLWLDSSTRKNLPGKQTSFLSSVFRVEMREVFYVLVAY